MEFFRHFEYVKFFDVLNIQRFEKSLHRKEIIILWSIFDAKLVAKVNVFQISTYVIERNFTKVCKISVFELREY